MEDYGWVPWAVSGVLLLVTATGLAINYRLARLVAGKNIVNQKHGRNMDWVGVAQREVDSARRELGTKIDSAAAGTALHLTQLEARAAQLDAKVVEGQTVAVRQAAELQQQVNSLAQGLPALSGGMSDLHDRQLQIMRVVNDIANGLNDLNDALGRSQVVLDLTGETPTVRVPPSFTSSPPASGQSAG